MGRVEFQVACIYQILQSTYLDCFHTPERIGSGRRPDDM